MSYIGQLVGDYYNLIEALEDHILEHGDPSEDIVKQLEIKEEELDKKLEGYHFVIKNRKSIIEQNKDRIESLRGDNEKLDKLITTLKDNAKAALNLYGDVGKSGNRTRKLNGLSIYTVNKDSVNVFNDDNIPNDCFNYKINMTLDYDTYVKFHTLLSEHTTDLVELFNSNLKTEVNKQLVKEKLDRAGEDDHIHNSAEIESKDSIIFRESKRKE